jgi:hypothetical protein
MHSLKPLVFTSRLDASARFIVMYVLDLRYVKTRAVEGRLA